MELIYSLPFVVSKHFPNPVLDPKRHALRHAAHEPVSLPNRLLRHAMATPSRSSGCQEPPGHLRSFALPHAGANPTESLGAIHRCGMAPIGGGSGGNGSAGGFVVFCGKSSALFRAFFWGGNPFPTQPLKGTLATGPRSPLRFCLLFLAPSLFFILLLSRSSCLVCFVWSRNLFCFVPVPFASFAFPFAFYSC